MDTNVKKEILPTKKARCLYKNISMEEKTIISEKVKSGWSCQKVMEEHNIGKSAYYSIKIALHKASELSLQLLGQISKANKMECNKEKTGKDKIMNSGKDKEVNSDICKLKTGNGREQSVQGKVVKTDKCQLKTGKDKNQTGNDYEKKNLEKSIAKTRCTFKNIPEKEKADVLEKIKAGWSSKEVMADHYISKNAYNTLKETVNLEKVNQSALDKTNQSRTSVEGINDQNEKNKFTPNAALVNIDNLIEFIDNTKEIYPEMKTFHKPLGKMRTYIIKRQKYVRQLKMQDYFKPQKSIKSNIANYSRKLNSTSSASSQPKLNSTYSASSQPKLNSTSSASS